MFLIIALVLILLWLGGLTLAVGGALIHLLLIIAVISIVWHFLSGRRTRVV